MLATIVLFTVRLRNGKLRPKSDERVWTIAASRTPKAKARFPWDESVRAKLKRKAIFLPITMHVAE